MLGWIRRVPRRASPDTAHGSPRRPVAPRVLGVVRKHDGMGRRTGGRPVIARRRRLERSRGIQRLLVIACRTRYWPEWCGSCPAGDRCPYNRETGGDRCIHDTGFLPGSRYRNQNGVDNYCSSRLVRAALRSSSETLGGTHAIRLAILERDCLMITITTWPVQGKSVALARLTGPPGCRYAAVRRMDTNAPIGPI